MSYYRTYRPQNIDEVDNAKAKEELERLIREDAKKLPHAYLLSGPRGIGKTTTARLIAKVFNCSTRKKGAPPCGTCDQCRTITAGTNLDVLEIDGASNRGIDEARQLKERAGLAPSQALFTVYIIDEVHMLTTEAFNALLKILEEPPAHVVFVMATTELHKVPVTVRSRCIHLAFGKASREELISSLKRIQTREKLEIDDDVFPEIAKIADGSFRDAVKFLEQLSLVSGHITLDIIRQNFHSADTASVSELVTHMEQGDTVRAVEYVKSFASTGADVKVLMTALLSSLRESLLSSISGKTVGKVAVSTSHYGFMIKTLIQAYASMKYSPISELPLIVAIAEICAYMSGNPPPSSPAAESAKPVRGGHETAEHVPEKQSASVKTELRNTVHAVEKAVRPATPDVPSIPEKETLGLITMEKLVDCWKDVIEELKSANHSIAGVLRSTRPKSVANGVVTIEAFYSFHMEKLSEPKVKEIMCKVFKKLFGESATIQVVLGKK